jgi:hypothetical protein
MAIVDPFDKPQASGGIVDPFDKTDQTPKNPLAPPYHAAPEEKPRETTFAEEALGSVAEPVMQMATGFAGKVAGDVAGLGAMAADIGGTIAGKKPGDVADPMKVKKAVEDALTYKPRTTAGQSEFNPLVAIPHVVGAVLDWAGRQAKDVIEPDDNAPATPANEARRAAGRAVEEAIHQAPNVLGVKGAKAAAEALPAKQAALDVVKGENKVIDATRDAAQAAGYRTPPETPLKAAVSDLAGRVKGEKQLSEHNEINATKRLSAEVGVPEGGALSDAEFENLKRDAGKDYDAIGQAAGPTLDVTPAFESGLVKTLKRVNNALAYDAKTYEGLRPAKALIESYLRKIGAPEQAPPMKGLAPIEKTIAKTAQEQPGPAISRTIEQAAADAPFHFGVKPAPSTPIPTPKRATLDTQGTINAIGDLRKQAKKDFAAKDTDMGETRLGIANLLENMVEENLAKTGKQDLLNNYKAARQRFAKIYLLERITNDATGRVNLQKLASLSDTAAYKRTLTGEFKTAADVAKAFRKATQKGTGEPPARLTVLDGLFAASAFVHPAMIGPAIAEIGGRIAIPELARRGALQKKTPSYKASTLPQRAAPVAGVTAAQAAQDRARARKERVKRRKDEEATQ